MNNIGPLSYQFQILILSSSKKRNTNRTQFTKGKEKDDRAR